MIETVDLDEELEDHTHTLAQMIEYIVTVKKAIHAPVIK